MQLSHNSVLATRLILKILLSKHLVLASRASNSQAWYYSFLQLVNLLHEIGRFKLHAAICKEKTSQSSAARLAIKP